MNFRSDHEDNGGIPSDFLGAKPWIVMNEAQKNAHAQEMLANADRIRTETKTLKLKHPFELIKIGGLYFLIFVILISIGFVAGFNWPR